MRNGKEDDGQTFSRADEMHQSTDTRSSLNSHQDRKQKFTPRCIIMRVQDIRKNEGYVKDPS